MWENRLRRLLDRPNLEDLYEGLRNLVEELAASLDPVAVVVAGSLARGEFVRGMSDIDLLVLVRGAPSRHERFCLRNVEGVDVEITVYQVEEAVRSAEAGNFFILDALANGVVIRGRLPQSLVEAVRAARRRC